MQRVHSNTALPPGADDIELKDDPLIAAVAAATGASTALGVTPQRTRSYTNVTISGDTEAVRKFRRRRSECSCPLHQIAISVTVFSFMAWVSYLFLTKDE
ncbi:unnamed protein product [Closterium sp. NIES-64]|nr:unnamed protein product [Closterium sp. Naga37s-1]CAI5953600.1 unnamed protein product [Closterium sp. NIES-65]CAI5961173.1 unnamed protein product [Closterium sp. NIES-64]